MLCSAAPVSKLQRQHIMLSANDQLGQAIQDTAQGGTSSSLAVYAQPGALQ